MKKVVAVISLAALLFSFMSLPVFAGDYQTNVYFRSSKIRSGLTGDTWVDATAWSSWDNSTGIFKVYRSSIPEAAEHVFGGLDVSWTTAAFMVVQPGYYLTIDLQLYDAYTPGSYMESNPMEHLLTITLTDGSVHKVNPISITYQPMTNGNERWVVKFAARFAGDSSIGFSEINYYTTMPSAGAGLSAYTVYTDFNIGSEISPELQRHEELITTITGAAQDIIDNADENTQEIIDNADENTQEIIDNADENTQEIIDNADENTDEIVGAIGDQTEELTNGWETDQDPAGDLNDSVGSLEVSESAALGGKSDDEIKQDVVAALQTPDLGEESAQGVMKVAATFDSILDAFGGEYQSLLILALTLGLAAFLVGKSYRAKGD